MTRKKIVFVIVEGPSDEEALGAVLSKYFENNRVYVEIMHMDITTKKGVEPTNIIKEICKVVKEYASRNHFNSSHFKRIIHIVDTDGAFCSEESIIEDETTKAYIYCESKLITFNKENATLRNKKKSQNLEKISRTSTVWNIPYNVYYMSCNLEHVLFNKLNCSDEEKEELSYRFALKYKDNIQEFVNYISNSPFSVKEDYISSWRFIQSDDNSLKRYTNFALCLDIENEEV